MILSSTWLCRDSGPESSQAERECLDLSQQSARGTNIQVALSFRNEKIAGSTSWSRVRQSVCLRMYSVDTKSAQTTYYNVHVVSFVHYASFHRICFFRFLQQHLRENLASLAQAVDHLGPSCETKTRQTMTGFDLQSWDCKIAGVLLLPSPSCGLAYRTIWNITSNITMTASCASSCLDVRCSIPNA